ncbi:MAG: tyrosine-type recombinase/integrase, partial [Thermoplasmatales archaeon]|nr:tyrosine-type recombinase/integrase [Thermoplasmatales archaeon]
NVEDALFNYAEDIEEKPKKTQVACFSAIKKFLDRHEINVKAKTWEDLRIRNNLNRSTYALTKKATPTQSDLKKILSYCTGVKSRALFMFLASTGLRIEESLLISFDNIDMKKREVELVEEGKFELPRYTFFTPEVQEQLELWIPERERMLQRRYKTSKYIRDQFKNMGYEVKREDIFNTHTKGKPYYRWKVYKDGKELSKEEIIGMENRVFPFDYITAQRMWANLLEKAGAPYNKKDNNPKLQHPRYVYNIHSLRRYWLTQLMFERANKEYVDYMGGHWTNLDAVYKYENPRMRAVLKEEYDQHMKGLLIFESQPDVSDIREQLKEVTHENKGYEDLIQQLKEQNERIERVSNH